jgi:hypothetical protein
MRDRLYEFGPFSIFLGHDVGLGTARVDGCIHLVTRAWGIGIGPIGLAYVQNVTGEALDDWRRRRAENRSAALPVDDEKLPIPTVGFDSDGEPVFFGSVRAALTQEDFE